MSKKRSPPSRTGMSAQERQARARLAQLFNTEGLGLLRARIASREVRCSYKPCRCHHGGPRHPLRIIETVLDRRSRQTTMPRELEPTVQAWIDHYREIRELLEVLSRLHWERVKRREV